MDLLATPLLGVLTAAAWMAAALCLFLLLLNRRLILIKDGAFKRRIIAATFVILLGGSAILGYRAGWSLWLVLPALMLAAVAAGEARRAVLRHRLRGSPPLWRDNAGLQLGQPLTTTELQVAHYGIDLPAWPGHELFVAHVSDFHVNDRIPAEYYKAVVQRVSEARADLVFITGDFITELDFVPRLGALLAPIESRLGTFAVLGNHDCWAGADTVARAVRDAGLVLLENDCRRVEVNGNTVLVCGCDDPWAERRWQPPPAPDGELLLALTHTADNIYRLSRAGVAAAFAGHYHAGQVRIPLLGPIVVPSRYGRRFDHGHFVVEGTHLFVTAGVGSASPSMRVYCRPDVFLVRIRKAA